MAQEINIKVFTGIEMIKNNFLDSFIKWSYNIYENTHIVSDAFTHPDIFKKDIFGFLESKKLKWQTNAKGGKQWKK